MTRGLVTSVLSCCFVLFPQSRFSLARGCFNGKRPVGTGPTFERTNDNSMCGSLGNYKASHEPLVSNPETIGRKEDRPGSSV